MKDQIVYVETPISQLPKDETIICKKCRHKFIEQDGWQSRLYFPNDILCEACIDEEDCAIMEDNDKPKN